MLLALQSGTRQKYKGLCSFSPASLLPLILTPNAMQPRDAPAAVAPSIECQELPNAGAPFLFEQNIL
jgi:hypothetical protein